MRDAADTRMGILRVEPVPDRDRNFRTGKGIRLTGTFDDPFENDDGFVRLQIFEVKSGPRPFLRVP